MSEDFKREVVGIEDIMRDGKRLADLDFDKIELASGKTPEDIAEKCLKVCKDYLSGNWSLQTVDTIEVRRITGGLLNQMYYCGIRQQNNSEGVPQEVVIKFYGEFRPNLDGDDKSKNKELVISLLFSEKGIGPKVLGIFEGGQIQKFYKQRGFENEDKNNPDIAGKVFRTLARIHSLEFPIKKNGKVMVEMLDKSYEEGFERLNKLLEENSIEIFKKYDLKAEIEWIKGVIERINSPEVLCHLDYRSSNLMITEPDNELVVCDFDSSGYNYRGSDFSMMMREWKNKHFFINIRSIEGLPLGSELRPFIEIYVEECVRIHGKSFTENENNSVEHILKEAKIFLLFSYLFFTAIHFRGPPKLSDNDGKGEQNRMNGKKPPPPPPNPKVMMEMVEINYKNYLEIKEILCEQKLFD